MKEENYKYIIIGVVLILIIYVIVDVCGCFKQEDIGGTLEEGLDFLSPTTVPTTAVTVPYSFPTLPQGKECNPGYKPLINPSHGNFFTYWECGEDCSGLKHNTDQACVCSCVPVNSIMLDDNKFIKFSGRSNATIITAKTKKEVEVRNQRKVVLELDDNLQIQGYTNLRMYAYNGKNATMPITGKIGDTYKIERFTKEPTIVIPPGFVVELRKYKDKAEEYNDVIYLKLGDTQPSDMGAYRYFKIHCDSNVSQKCCDINSYKGTLANDINDCFPHSYYANDFGTNKYHISNNKMNMHFIPAKAFPRKFILSNHDKPIYSYSNGNKTVPNYLDILPEDIFDLDDIGDKIKHKRIFTEGKYINFFTIPINQRKNIILKQEEQLVSGEDTLVKVVTILNVDNTFILNSQNKPIQYDVVDVTDEAYAILSRVETDKNIVKISDDLIRELNDKIYSSAKPALNYSYGLAKNFIKHTRNNTITGHIYYDKTNIVYKYRIEGGQCVGLNIFPVTLSQHKDKLVYIDIVANKLSVIPIQMSDVKTGNSECFRNISREGFQNKLSLLTCIDNNTGPNLEFDIFYDIEGPLNSPTAYRMKIKTKSSTPPTSFVNTENISIFALYEHNANKKLDLVSYSTPYYRQSNSNNNRLYLEPLATIELNDTFEIRHHFFTRDKYKYESDTTKRHKTLAYYLPRLQMNSGTFETIEGILEELFKSPDTTRISANPHKLYVFKRIDEEKFVTNRSKGERADNKNKIKFISQNINVTTSCNIENDYIPKETMYEFVISSITSNSGDNEFLKQYNKVLTEYDATLTTIDIERTRINNEIRDFNNIKSTIQELLRTEHQKTQRQNADYQNTTINRNFRAIYVENLKLIKENNNTQKRLIQIKVNYQQKIRFSFNIHQNGEYKNELNSILLKLKAKFRELGVKLEQNKTSNYKNAYKTSQIIAHLNENIKSVKALLSIKDKDKDSFQNTDLSSYIGYFDVISSKNQDIFDKYLDVIKEYEGLAEHAANLNAVISEVILLIPLYYMERLKQTQIVKNEQVVRDLIEDLNKTLEGHKREKRILEAEVRDWNIVNENADLKIVDYKKGDYNIDKLELDIVDLEEKIEEHNKIIVKSNNYERVSDQLKLITQLKKEAVFRKILDENPFNIDGFQSGGNQGQSPERKTKNDIFNNTINSIQSHFNNEHISVIPIDDGGSQDNINSYKIVANNQCVTVYGDNKYCLDNCSKVSPSQYFRPQYIKNKDDALKYNKVEPVNEEIKYPYYQMKSEITQNCLSVNNEGISLSPCDSNSIQQHWNTRNDEKLCLMD